MFGILPLRNPTMAYDWGSKTAIPQFLGRPESPEPVAEEWLGAHPKASSEVCIEGSWSPLHEAVQQDPEIWLGVAAAQTFEGRLPFLFKILAAAKPLSIQAHPNLDQAQQGFEREEKSGLARWHRNRNYRDRNHKPEIIYALTPFTALCGFRPPAEIHSLLERFQIGSLLPGAAELESRGGLAAVFSGLLALDSDLLGRILETALGVDDPGPERRWMQRMQGEFPGDRGILAPLFLNLRTLEPGEAMYTGPGILHAYLDGLGIELMANSDNVLRGGCTSKHVDPDELLRVVRFEHHTPHMVRVERPIPGVEIFKTPAREFELSKLTIDRVQPFDSRALPQDPGPQILLCCEGQGEIHTPTEPVHFGRGSSYFVPAALPGFRIQGQGVFFRATLGDPVDP